MFPIMLLGLVTLVGCTNMPPAPVVPSTSPRTSTPVSPDTTQVVVGVDGIGGGYNPHLLADRSAATGALAAMLLPSVFRTAPDGTPRLDSTLAVSAQVTSASPFTVTYQLRTDASWSDGTPIDAADFLYLTNQMSTQPGTVDSAGYRLISHITARDNGKVIQVMFAKPYPGWRSLFTDLLPAHLLKDAPGGWDNALSDSFPATAGPFNIKTIDNAGGEITLERNDRYWDKPSVLDKVVLRKTADHPSMAAALKAGSDQLAYSRVDATGLTELRHQLDTGFSFATVPRPEMATVLLRPGGPDLGNQAVRTAVAAALDRNALINAGTQHGPAAALRADALVMAPSQAGYAATLTAADVQNGPNPGTVHDKLTQAGFTPAGGQWTRAGQPLRVTIAAQNGVEPYLSIAKQIQQQLTAAGIQAVLATPSGTQLYEQEITGGPTTAAQTSGPQTGGGTPDIVVGPQPVDPDSATGLASWFGCPQTLPDGTTLAPANPLGFCDQGIQPTIDAALTGEMSLSDALARVEPELWAQAVEIPLFQLADELVVGPDVTGVDAGPPLAGPFGGAAGWSRATG